MNKMFFIILILSGLGCQSYSGLEKDKINTLKESKVRAVSSLDHHIPYLETILTTGFIKSLNKTISLRTENKQSGEWSLTVYNKCPKYPCNPKDHTVVETIFPKITSDEAAADGCLKLLLKENIRLSYCPDGLSLVPKETPYQLRINEKSYNIYIKGMITTKDKQL